ncbi:hypothetical protein G6F16_000693 [Rhizopus arrhizus]|nr:hypothetical protein G6F22_000625 [Rhizopus arrhizus]KAG0819548.1 hypothetical protein G6F20_000678 [Rhizopus arrhizus]KAG0843086.1 hypothetical protein G6F19_000705 [Rhizopus arrhizus]KAG0845627.1 hypothetical protein G6F18_000789 [Rhizopus arrhizus]KAG0878729.1 hypothetical protein G6F16_000693 [Rhizopus arrhizus]
MFQVFPGKYSQVVTFGTPLMDAGVGSFALSHGIIVSQSYHKTDLWKSLRSGSTLAALVISYWAYAKDFEYNHSDIGLYLVFALSLLPPFLVLLRSLRRLAPFFVPALFTAVAYEYALKNDMLDTQKWGGFFGLLSLFLFGLQIGESIFKVKGKFLVDLKSDPTFHLGIITILPAIFTEFWQHTSSEYGISRKTANLPYVFWILALNGLILVWTVLFDITYKLVKAPSLLEAMNDNSLLMFLLANFLTWIIQMTVVTECMEFWSSIVLNICYLLVIIIIPWTVCRSPHPPLPFVN